MQTDTNQNSESQGDEEQNEIEASLEAEDKSESEQSDSKAESKGEHEPNENMKSPYDDRTPEDRSKSHQKETPPRVMILEYLDWKKGQHNHSVIIKNPGDKRGKVSARIFTEFGTESKRPSYTARDAEGKNLFPPTEKLWELKKTIKQNAKELYEKSVLYQKKFQNKEKTPSVSDMTHTVVEKGLNESKEGLDTVVGLVAGENTRANEIKNVRQKKNVRSKDMGLER